MLASGNPYYTADAGAEVARRLGVPWVVDLEDPWAFDEMRVHPTALHHRAELRWMRRALRTVSAVITLRRGGGRADPPRRCPSSPTG